MTNHAAVASQLPEPTFDEMSIYGDVVILRRHNRGIENTSICRKQDGCWRAVQVQVALRPPVRSPVTVHPKTLDRFVGAYEFRFAAQAVVVRQGNATTWKAGTNRHWCFCHSPRTGSSGRAATWRMTFSVDVNGEVDE
jgi:hypothetical protein